jgi:hypothetical protein
MLRARMAERWDATCLRARVDPEQLDKVWDTYAKCIARGGP